MEGANRQGFIQGICISPQLLMWHSAKGGSQPKVAHSQRWHTAKGGTQPKVALNNNNIKNNNNRHSKQVGTMGSKAKLYNKM